MLKLWIIYINGKSLMFGHLSADMRVTLRSGGDISAL